MAVGDGEGAVACCPSSVCNVIVWLQVMERALWHVV